MEKGTAQENQLHPFANIALTFSGGGFRAAAFSLGALSYLKQIKLTADDSSLLDNVTYISSTSGGSFTNALYSAYMHRGKSFEELYAKLLNEMTGQHLLQEVFSILEDDAQWNQPGNDKQKNLINAFAKAYDKVLYEQETFAVFWNKEYVPEFEVCFNSTEFYRGLSFRFQTDGTNGGKQIIGNKFLHFNTKQMEVIKKLKLADMVAASSCFPAGFEPIMYPQDFSYSAKGEVLSVEDLKKAMLFENYQEEVETISDAYGFMDGGITDNQGLYSAMLADKKRRARVAPDPFDLIMVTDVTSYFMDEYKAPAEETKVVWKQNNINYYLDIVKAAVKKITGTVTLFTLLFLVLFIASVASILFSLNGLVSIAASFVSGVSVVMLVLIYFARQPKIVQWIWNNKEKIEQDIFIDGLAKSNNFISEKIMIRLVWLLKVTKISLLEQMIRARIFSMLSMLLDINLKQTRRLIYEMFYNDEIWENRRVPNFIYELSAYNNTSRNKRFNNAYRLKWKATDEDKELFLDDCEKLNDIAEEARKMGTTLWFDEKDVASERLKKIVATGQFTTCCNLLEYIVSLERKEIQFETQTSEKLLKIKTRLMEDFIHFKTEPFFLYDKLK